MNPVLTPNDKIRRLVMVKEIEAILRSYMPPLPPQVNELKAEGLIRYGCPNRP